MARATLIVLLDGTASGTTAWSSDAPDIVVAREVLLAGAEQVELSQLYLLAEVRVRGDFSVALYEAAGDLEGVPA